MLTLDKVIPALHNAVQLKGADYVYPGSVNGNCYYADYTSQAPSCIVGHVIAELDADAYQEIVEFEGNNSSSASVAELAGDSFSQDEVPLVDMDFDTRELLSWVQSSQDAGTPWGVAVEKGLARLRSNV